MAFLFLGKRFRFTKTFTSQKAERLFLISYFGCGYAAMDY